MPTPTGNIQNDRIQTTDDPSTQASPQPTPNGYVEFEKSDMAPERIERIGQYLSDTTSNNNANEDAYTGAYGLQDNAGTGKLPHQSGKTKADYEISSPGNLDTDRFEQDALGEAMDYFKDLKNDPTFDPGIVASNIGADERANAPNLKYGDGHKLLNGKAQKIIEDHIDEGRNQNLSQSRWAHIGKPQFTGSGPSGDGGSQPFWTTTLGMNPIINNDPNGSKGSRHVDYKTEGIFRVSDKSGDNVETFWEDYFGRLAKVGPSLQKRAANQDPNEGQGGGRFRFGSGVGFGGPSSIDQLNGSWKMIDMSDLDAKLMMENNLTEVQALQINKLSAFNNKSFGQHYTPDSHFFTRGFTLVENGNLTVIVMLLEIFLAMSIRVLLVAGILEIANQLVGSIAGGKKNPFDNSYYPQDPQSKDPRDYEKGRSGWRHSLGNPGAKLNNILTEVQSRKEDRTMVGVLLSQVTGGAVRSAANIFDREVINFTQNICRELDLYLPRHHLSQVANATGYNEDSSEPLRVLKDLGKGVMKLLDVGTAYIRSCTAGLAVVGVNVLGDVDGRGVGYWRTLLREITRSNATIAERRNEDSQEESAYSSLMKTLGEGDKLMRFMNYLCIVGDLSVATGATGRLPFPEMDVPLDLVGNHPMLRTATTRLKDSNQGRLSLGALPSLMLSPVDSAIAKHNMENLGLGSSGYGGLKQDNPLYVVQSPLGEGPKEILKAVGQKHQKKPTGRFTPDQVRLMEDQLEAEHMPFYIQDLRTNEIIAFHAFLNSISDSYTGEWSAQKGFGRMEAAQIYSGGSRSIGVSFTLVAMNPDDFDEMYVKINKLTTLVYPQWSRGTLMQQGTNKFVQPFSQVPTASPLCRIRVGDLFTSNYSKQAMARMMGIGEPEFVYGQTGNGESHEGNIEMVDSGEKYLSRSAFREALASVSRSISKEDRNKLYEDYLANPQKFTVELRPEGLEDTWEIACDLTDGPNGVSAQISRHGSENAAKAFLRKSSKFLPIPESADAGGGAPGFSAAAVVREVLSATRPKGIADLFSNEKNPIFKSFESTMGRGIAVAINSIGLEWKLNSAPWNLEVGDRAPRMCEVSLGLIPIHDITPGLDHNGYNRAPIYKVGSSRDATGDVWYNADEFGTLEYQINEGRADSLAGNDPDDLIGDD